MVEIIVFSLRMMGPFRTFTKLSTPLSPDPSLSYCLGSNSPLSLFLYTKDKNAQVPAQRHRHHLPDDAPRGVCADW